MAKAFERNSSLGSRNGRFQNPGRVSQFGKRLLSRAHRTASSTCKNFFLKTPPTSTFGKKSSGKPSTLSALPHAPRGVRRAFPPSAGGMQFEGEKRKGDKT